jgi:hypothetical protein
MKKGKVVKVYVEGIRWSEPHKKLSEADRSALLFKKELCDLANAFHPATFGDLRAEIEKCEIFAGVFPSHAEPGQVGIFFIKGYELLRDAADADETVQLRCGAVRCRCLDEAVAIQQVVEEADSPSTRH